VALLVRVLAVLCDVCAVDDGHHAVNVPDFDDFILGFVCTADGRGFKYLLAHLVGVILLTLWRIAGIFGEVVTLDELAVSLAFLVSVDDFVLVQ